MGVNLMFVSVCVPVMDFGPVQAVQGVQAPAPRYLER